MKLRCPLCYRDAFCSRSRYCLHCGYGKKQRNKVRNFAQVGQKVNQKATRLLKPQIQKKSRNWWDPLW